MRVHVRFLLTCLLLSVAALAHAGVDEGMSAYSSGDYDKAAREFKAMAERGDREAQYMLGLLHEEGQGVERDDLLAAYWYARSADQGFADAYYALGQLFLHRKGDRQDRMAAHHWFCLAKEHGHRLGEQEIQRNLKAMPPDLAELARNRYAERRLSATR